MKRRRTKTVTLSGDPLWYKDAVVYELRVRSFADGVGNGIGDFAGLRQKLPYLESLGITAIWLLPFYPSPLRDDGYDIADYMDVHPDVGTLDDFKAFLEDAHSRGLRVITELVLNHTSNEHPWFKRARRAPAGSVERNYYLWSDTADRFREARVIFQDFEVSNWTWDPVAGAYFWHRFYAHQPDLNFDNPAVHREMFKVVDFWLGLGVDGLRLDAIPYLYEREGTNCENLPEGHHFLEDLRHHIDKKFPNRMLLAEANQWPEDAVAYLGPDECHMAFHFPIMPRMFMALFTEDRFPLVDILGQTPPLHESCQWALFLRNHDELTLEMVTDEERDEMCRAYAREQRMRVNLGIRRRLAPLLGNDRRTIELLNGLLLSLPGTPFLYYGDEIGMGDNVYLGDRDGVRTPMQWSPDRNAGFSRANPQKLVLPVIIDPEYHYEAINVEAQEQNQRSLLWWMRRVIALRAQSKAFGRGTFELVNADNPRVFAFVRTHGDERILVVANLSRFVQYTELDLHKFAGSTPREMFGGATFPAIADKPYALTIGAHTFYWFSLPAASVSLAKSEPYRVPRLTAESPRAVLREPVRGELEAALPDFLRTRRWFRSKTRQLRAVTIVDTIPLPNGDEAALHIVRADYADGESDQYVVPLALLTDERAEWLRRELPDAVVAEIDLARPSGVTKALLADALADPGFARRLLGLFDRRREARGIGGLQVSVLDGYEALKGTDPAALEPRIQRGEQTNTSILYGERLVLKMFRRMEPGPSPEAEMGRFLVRHGFPNTPALGATLDYRKGRGTEAVTLGTLHAFVPHATDAWTYTADQLRRFADNVLVRPDAPPPSGDKPLCDLLEEPTPVPIAEAMGAYLEVARLLGRRTAELHQVLVSPTDDPAFTTETFSKLYQRSVYQSMRNLVGQNLRLLRRTLGSLPAEAKSDAQAVLEAEPTLLKRFEIFLHQRVSIVRQRIHGDFHLGQVLFTGKDFYIIDFEGEPARSPAHRRRKRAAMRDVAGMIRSFHYSALTTMNDLLARGQLDPRQRETITPWFAAWQTWASCAFLREYLLTAGNAPFVPRERPQLRVLLDAYLLEKAVYELGYELGNRPAWVAIPLRGIRSILGSPHAG